MKRFVNRDAEVRFLNEQYESKSAAMVILYGRRRVGKTSLIHEFAQGKPFLYFLASEEAEHQNMRVLKDQIAEYTGDALLAQASVDNWDILFQTLIRHIGGRRLVLVLDEFQYLGKTNPAFPSVFQRIWEKLLHDKNIMVILCGSLIHMMEEQTLNYNSPLYGRRTGQIKLRQIDFQHYPEFFDGLSYKDLIEHYAVTGGVPKYIELFDGRADLFSEIERHILDKQSLLFEEPVFLLQNEVTEVGSYFSIIKSIAAGNHKLGKICADLEVKQTSMPKYLKTLIDLDILEREVPVTESNPEKSKMGLYRLKDNFLSFWFRFVYPEKARLELGDISYVSQKIRANFVDSHAAYVYEAVCQSEMWQLARQGRLDFNKLGRWWSNKEEIDIVGFDSGGDEIVFGECKYRNAPMDTDVFESLLRKTGHVPWKKDSRKEQFVLFSISGFADRLQALAANRDDLILFEKTGMASPER
jgi:AAA+ ATPase superfamily predicted ATPase